MSPDDLKAAAIEMWGERGWITSLASSLEVDRTQIWRYLNNKTDVPGPVKAAVRCWLRRFRETGERPQADPPPRSGGGGPPKAVEGARARAMSPEKS